MQTSLVRKGRPRASTRSDLYLAALAALVLSPVARRESPGA